MLINSCPEPGNDPLRRAIALPSSMMQVTHLLALLARPEVLAGRIKGYLPLPLVSLASLHTILLFVTKPHFPVVFWTSKSFKSADFVTFPSTALCPCKSMATRWLG